MGSGSRPAWVAAVSIAAVVASVLACEGSYSSATGALDTTLPRNVVVSLSVVNRFFPEITQQDSTGPNSTATGNPKATRIVIYAADGGSKKVTITVDQYGSSSDASSAYKQAVERVSQFRHFNLLRNPIWGYTPSPAP